jgi:acetylornithine deacetylase
VNVGKIAGGTAVNIIAPACCFEWECRTAPGSDPSVVENALAAFTKKELLPRWRQVSPSIGIETDQCLAVPPLKPDLPGPLRGLVRDLAGQRNFVALPFASEAGLFQQAGIPSVVCGPGSVAQAHQPDEYVEESQLRQCVAMMQRLANWSDRMD